MTDASGSTAWVYDPRGRLFTESKVIDDQAYTTQWGYNSADLPVEMVYPDGEELTYLYNGDGSLNSVTSDLNGTYLAATQYDEAGRIKQLDYGASVLRKTFAYFPWNTTIQGGLLDTAVTSRTGDSTTLQSLAYTYDKNANVRTIVDNPAGPQTQTFTYDALNRLDSAVVTGGTSGLYSETYEYNPSTGNLSTKAGVSYTYEVNHPHAVASLSNGNTYEYDPNGNMIQRNLDSQTFDLTYDAENRLVSVSSSGGPAPTSTPTASETPVATSTNTTTPTPTDTPTPTATDAITFPDNSVLDGFNRANGSIGGNWVGVLNSSAFSISSSQLVNSSSGTDSVVGWNANFGANQEAYFTFTQVGTGDRQDLLLKADFVNYRSVDIRYDAVNEVVQVWTTNVQNLVQHGADISVAFENGDQFGARALADGTVEVYKNGSLLATRSITSWPYYNQGGLIGLWFSNVTGATLDDFGGGTLPQSSLPSIAMASLKMDRPVSLSPGTSGHLQLVGYSLPSNDVSKRLFQPFQQSGFPSTAQLDDFNRSNGSIGSNWSGYTGAYSISSNQLLVTSVGWENPIYWNNSTFGSNQEAYVTISQLNTDSWELSLLLKSQSNNSFTDGMIELYYQASSDTLQVWTVDEDDWVQYGTDILVNLAVGDQFGARVLSDGTLEIYRNGNLLATRDLSSWEFSSYGGYIGVWFANATNQRLDDFGGGDVATNPTNTPAASVTPSFTGTATASFTPTKTATPTDTPLVTDTPTWTPTASRTPTPTVTNTPTHTPSPTHTDTPTVTTAPTTSVFSDATFIYDGDGKRVASEITSNLATTVTHFVGNYHEVTDGVVTKYYYAGAQRIAMRKGSDLFYLIGDHLGSTSLTTNATGTVVSELRYTAWGEVRYASGTTPTDYTYTGQFSYTADFGLMYYNARWYDPYLNHMTQPNSIVPDPANPQDWNRYSYARNNPLKYTDPTGHKVCYDVDASGKCTGDKLARFLDYFDKEIINEKGTLQKKYESDILGTMNSVVKRAASIFGNDWNGFFDATDYVFTGYFGHGAGTMWKAHRSDFQGYFDGDTGFHFDFVDKSNQVRHFWVALASAADPYGDNPFGERVRICWK